MSTTIRRSQSIQELSPWACAGFPGSEGAEGALAVMLACFTAVPLWRRVTLYAPCRESGTVMRPAGSGASVDCLPSGAVTPAEQFWSGVHAWPLIVSVHVAFAPTDMLCGQSRPSWTHLWSALQLWPDGHDGQPASVPHSYP